MHAEVDAHRTGHHRAKFVVVGGPGADKSTVAGKLESMFDIENIELDDLWWETEWRQAGAAVLRSRLEERIQQAQGWIIDGNYLAELDATDLWGAADRVVWLDLPRSVCFRRAVLRNVWRIVSRQRLWSGNREPLSNLGPYSLYSLWCRWPAYSAAIEASLPGFSPGQLVRLRSQREISAWLLSLRE